jgi:hypothetical protein
MTRLGRKLIEVGLLSGAGIAGSVFLIAGQPAPVSAEESAYTCPSTGCVSPWACMYYGDKVCYLFGEPGAICTEYPCNVE